MFNSLNMSRRYTNSEQIGIYYRTRENISVHICLLHKNLVKHRFSERIRQTF